MRIRYIAGSLYLPDADLWLDPRQPQTGSAQVFVSHAHSDHTAEHREVILSEPTARLMQARLPGERREHLLRFGERRSFGTGRSEFQLTLLPAGHIFGSSMGLVEHGGESLLYTGDFKLRPALSAEKCQPVHADVLVMETTFGRRHYVFPPTDSVLQGILRFCRESLDNDETPVLLGYSLGKSQELLCSLGEAELPIMLHGAVWKLTRIYEQFGQCFPKYERYEAGSARGHVLLCPPNVVNSNMLRNLGKVRTAILTGWAVDPGCRYRYQSQAAFPLSDHADFPDLLRMVQLVAPRKVYTLHGFAAEFAQTLRNEGWDAQALSEDEQLAFALPGEASSLARPSAKARTPAPPPPACEHKAGARFIGFAQTCAAIAGDSRKLEKIHLLADFLRPLRGEELVQTCTWFSGRPFASSENRILQLGWAVLRDALCDAAAVDEETLHQVYLKHSDLGETAAEVLADNNVQPSLRLEDIGRLFVELHAARGPLAKKPILVSAFRQCTAREIKYLVKIITGDLRIGLKEGLVEEAIAKAFDSQPEEVRRATLLLGDLGQTARLAAEHQLDKASLVPFRPIKFMLASPEATADDILSRVREWVTTEASGNSGPAGEASMAVWIEDKYDGVRCQLHAAAGRVALYSRDLKDITATFQELADAARKLPAEAILDGEIVAMRGDDVLPFSELQKRLGRKQGDLFMQDEIPIRFVAFDLLWMNGNSLLGAPLQQRRKTLGELLRDIKGFELAELTQATSVEEVNAAFEAARSRGNEGLMVKDPTSSYSPGRRGRSWLKLKKAFATLDCVVIGAEYGHGKRSKVLSDYTFAVRDELTGELRTIGKAYTGLTDAEIVELTKYFLNRALRQNGRYFDVPPEIVLEIAFDRLQPSARHSSGLAMRFPRIVRIRTDKSVAEIDTLATARALAEKLKRQSAAAQNA